MEGWSSEKEITDQDPDVLFSGTELPPIGAGCCSSTGTGFCI